MVRHIGLLLFPGITQLDLTGPYEVFARLPEIEVHLIWKTAISIQSDRGMTILADTAFENCPQLNVIMIPGGPGQIALMGDHEVLDFIKTQAKHADYITSVCTGSLVLGAAGLLQGYLATCHWSALNQLALFKATPVVQRVVVDRNRITGAGVTAGIDFAFTLANQLCGEDMTQLIQLQMDYNPTPPLTYCAYKDLSPELQRQATSRIATIAMKRQAASLAAAEKLHLL